MEEEMISKGKKRFPKTYLKDPYLRWAVLPQSALALPVSLESMKMQNAFSPLAGEIN